LAPGAHVVLLREEAQVVGARADTLEQRPGVGDVPKAAYCSTSHSEHARNGFSCPSDVDPRFGAIAQGESVWHERALRLGDGREHPQVVGCAEAVDREEQQEASTASVSRCCTKCPLALTP
jgi:hypothetical protein